MGFGQNFGWEMGFVTPLQDPLPELGVSKVESFKNVSPSLKTLIFFNHRHIVKLWNHVIKIKTSKYFYKLNFIQKRPTTNIP